MVCVPVAGPWVVVPASTGENRARVEYQLTCPRGHVVGGLDARLSVRGIDVSFLGRLGSPVNPGITTSRSAVFLGHLRRAIRSRTDLPPLHRLHACVRRRKPRSDVRDRFQTRRAGHAPREDRPRAARHDDRRPALLLGRAPRRRVARVRLRHANAPELRVSSEACRARSRSGTAASPSACAVTRSSQASARSSRSTLSARGPADEHRSPSARGRRGNHVSPAFPLLLEGVGNLLGPHAPPRSSTGDRPMSFKSPWLLLGLLVLAAAVAVWLLLDRRRARYAVRYTNLDVLATVVSGRSWPRYVPAALLVLGLASLFVGLARPQVERTQLEERATVILVVDTSRSMQAEDVEPDAARSRAGGDSHVPRPGARTTCASGSSCSPARRRSRLRRRRTTSSSTRQ